MVRARREITTEMAWNNGGPSPWGNPRPGGGGPWGGPPQGGGGGGGGRGPGQGPDIEEMIRNAQNAVRRFLPRGTGGGRAIGAVLLIVVAIWGASGFYRVQPDELGVVMRFGAFNRTTPPGLNYAIPWPVEQVTTPRVTRINRADVGFRAGADTTGRIVPARDVLAESLMLTGDENIIDVDFSVFWRIRDAGEFLFNTRNPEEAVKSAGESVMREVIGRTPIQPALTEARAAIEQEVRRLTQAMMDQYGSGVEITQVQLLKVDPPAAVIEAFRDVQRANTDRERLRNEAESFRNDIIPRARGEAERMVQEATGFRDSQIARARGEAGRFNAVLGAYSLAQDVTTRRIYLETMEEILRRNNMILVDDRLQGLVPFLQLEGQQQARGQGGSPAARQQQTSPAVMAPMLNPQQRPANQGGTR
ncbi:MAG TPA: FtsH protease activity modulator HflK [Roseococcus sp.]|nr:FtsH protease activity modulator HflK [Roseococcus sp.]